MRKKVVCFDLDDTLYKEIGFLYSGYRVISQVIEQRTGSTGVYDQMCQLRHDGKNVFEELEKKYRGVINKAEMLTIYREHKPSISLDDGIESLLDALKQSGCIIGLITDGRSISQRNKISALGLERWIDNQNIVISEEFGSEKPNEQNYLYFEKLYPGCRYYYIGDNVEKDFIAPNKLGWETYCLHHLYSTNIHTCDLEQVDAEKQPQHVVNCISRLTYEIIPPCENGFIVPIMIDVTREDTQVGTGVIVGKYLITAAHVFYNNSSNVLQYKFDGLKYELNLEYSIFDGHLMEKREDYSKDLLVFSVGHKGSPFSLNKGEVNCDLELHSRCYHYELERLRIDIIDGIKRIDTQIGKKNCLLLKTPNFSPFNLGNSGCPVYCNNVIYGTLWKEHKSTDRSINDYRYLFIDSRYIEEIIADSKK